MNPLETLQKAPKGWRLIPLILIAGLALSILGGVLAYWWGPGNRPVAQTISRFSWALNVAALVLLLSNAVAQAMMFRRILRYWRASDAEMKAFQAKVRSIPGLPVVMVAVRAMPDEPEQEDTRH